MRGYVEMAEYQKLSERLETAEAERDFYKSELGLLTDAAVKAAMKKAYRLTPAECDLVCLLYASRHRLATKSILNEIIPETSSDDRGIKIIDVWVCKIRQKIGADAIETIWGAGYKLTPKGVALIEAALGDLSGTRKAA